MGGHEQRALATRRKPRGLPGGPEWTPLPKQWMISAPPGMSPSPTCSMGSGVHGKWLCGTRALLGTQKRHHGRLSREGRRAGSYTRDERG